jgi:hypothetical protein
MIWTMNARRLLLIVILTLCVAGLSCKRLSRKNYKVDKFSPTGTYRVKIDVNVEDYPELMAGFHEWGKFELLKGDEILDSNAWDFKDNFEATFIDGTPVIEWAGNNVLRMGRGLEGLPFVDDLTISNDSGENLKYIHVSSDKHETLMVLDLAAADKITVRASPIPRWTDSQGAINYSLGYSGTSETGKKFSGALDESQRIAAADGAARFPIVIKREDLH